MRRVGIFLNSHSPRGMGLLCGVGKFVRSHGDWLITLHDTDIDHTLNGLQANCQYDGILASIQNAAAIQTLQNAALPIVDVCGRFDCPRIPRVVVDQRRVGILAYAHLISCGVPNVAFYGFAEDQQSRERLESIMQCAADDQRNVPVLRQCVGAGIDSAGDPMSKCSGSEAELEAWVRSLAKPVGVIAEDDWLGKRVLEACRRCGLPVPGEVGVIGSGSDEALREFCIPALSSVPIPNQRIGYQAADLLSTLMDGKAAPQHEILVSPANVAARSSTEGPVKRDACVSMALKFIQENACKGINTEDILDHLAQNSYLVSRSTLERRFRDALRRSPKDEILRVRIARAGELLMNTTYPLAKIAEMVSIQRPEHLSATFKRLTGQLPGELRRNMRSAGRSS